MSKLIYIGNLPQNTSQTDLKRLFSPFGSIKNIRIAQNFFTKQPLDYAFIKLDKLKSMEEAANKLNQSLYQKHELITKLIDYPENKNLKPTTK